MLLDMTMPVMGGREALRLIREIRPGVPIVVSSGYGEESARDELGLDTAAGFIQKPYSPAQLVRSMRDVL